MSLVLHFIRYEHLLAATVSDFYNSVFMLVAALSLEFDSVRFFIAVNVSQKSIVLRYANNLVHSEAKRVF